MNRRYAKLGLVGAALGLAGWEAYKRPVGQRSARGGRLVQLEAETWDTEPDIEYDPHGNESIRIVMGDAAARPSGRRDRNNGFPIEYGDIRYGRLTKKKKKKKQEQGDRKSYTPRNAPGMDADSVRVLESGTRTIELSDDLRDFNAGNWRRVQGFITKLERVDGPRTWGHVQQAYKTGTAPVIKQAFARWLVTQRFKLAGIRPGMSPAQLYDTVTMAVGNKTKTSGLPWWGAPSDKSMGTEDVFALRHDPATTRAQFSRSARGRERIIDLLASGPKSRTALRTAFKGYASAMSSLTKKNLLVITEQQIEGKDPGLGVFAGKPAPNLPAVLPTKRVLGLLSTSEKVRKGRKEGWWTAVMYASPYTEAGIDVCASSTAGCQTACLGHSTGQLTGMIQRARRMRRTLHHLLFPRSFAGQMFQEIGMFAADSFQQGLKPTFRLNGSSDIAWELPRNGAIPQTFPNFQFYDYTKLPFKGRQRAVDLDNYRLLYSYSEASGALEQSIEYLKNKGNVAVVVGAAGVFVADSIGHNITTQHNAARKLIKWTNRRDGGLYGYKAIDGDKDDLRFNDPKGTWVVLYAKGGFAARDRSGFVVRAALTANKRAGIQAGQPMNMGAKAAAKPVPFGAPPVDPAGVKKRAEWWARQGAAARSPFGGWSRGPSYWQYGNPQFDARNRPNTGRRNRRGQRALDGSELMDWYEDSSDRDC